MSDVGRPSVMTQEVLQKLEYAFSMGCTDNEACIHAGISPGSLYNYQKDNAEFLKRKEILKDTPILLARIKVINDIKSNVNTAQWYLERKKKDEFSSRTELTGKEGNEINIKLTHYGDNDTLQLATRETPTTNITEPSEIQSNSMASQSTQDDTSDKRTATMGDGSEGDLLVHSPLLQPSEEHSLVGTGNATEILSTGNMEEPQ